MVKILLAMWETWVWPLGWEDTLEEGMATYSSVLLGESPCTEEPGRLWSMGSQKVGYYWETENSTFILGGVSFIAQLVKKKILLQCRRLQFDSWVGNIHWRRDRLPTPVLFLGFPCRLAGKESPFNAGDLGSFPGLGRSPGEGKFYPLQYSGLENSMAYIVQGVTKSWTWLSNFHFHFTEHKGRHFQSTKRKKKLSS